VPHRAIMTVTEKPTWLFGEKINLGIAMSPRIFGSEAARWALKSFNSVRATSIRFTMIELDYFVL
jgi:hypothetical protein